MAVVKVIELLTESEDSWEAAAQEAVNRVAGYGRGIPPGTSEWQVLVDKHKDEIAARRGYVLG